MSHNSKEPDVLPVSYWSYSWSEVTESPFPCQGDQNVLRVVFYRFSVSLRSVGTDLFVCIDGEGRTEVSL